MSFQQGLSGLNAASKTLESIGNNIANANTVGFKAGQVQFADVYANSLSGAGGGGATGIGTKVSQVAQQFTQGNITASANPLDIAINGGGFFRMSNNGAISYARNGQFQLSKEGFITNASGARLTGFSADGNGVLATGAPVELQISNADLTPKTTTSVQSQLNLDSTKTAIAAAFDKDVPATYHNATSVNVYDGLGNAHTLQTFYVKTGPNAWTVYGAFDDGATVQQLAAPIGNITFNGSGAIATPAPPAPAAFTVTLTPAASTGAAPFPVTVDLSGTTQFGSAFSVNTLTQDGYTSGRLSGFNTDGNGIITGRYTNGKTATLGQVVLANFTNPNGLQPLGNNAWAESASSGQPLVSTPNSGNLGVLQSSAVEDSNTDLTAELVTMITAQRVYQANAQTIKTQDQILQTLVNLK
jgi:flagellar hook protein FlgE